MLAELKDLAQKGLFTQVRFRFSSYKLRRISPPGFLLPLQKEIKQIMKKRTSFETALVRRVPKKGDYLRYIAYEISLEALRKKRADRLSA